MGSTQERLQCVIRKTAQKRIMHDIYPSRSKNNQSHIQRITSITLSLALALSLCPIMPKPAEAGELESLSAQIDYSPDKDTYWGPMFHPLDGSTAGSRIYLYEIPWLPTEAETELWMPNGIDVPEGEIKFYRPIHWDMAERWDRQQQCFVYTPYYVLDNLKRSQIGMEIGTSSKVDWSRPQSFDVSDPYYPGSVVAHWNPDDKSVTLSSSDKGTLNTYWMQLAKLIGYNDLPSAQKLIIKDPMFMPVLPSFRTSGEWYEVRWAEPFPGNYGDDMQLDLGLREKGHWGGDRAPSMLENAQFIGFENFDIAHAATPTFLFRGLSESAQPNIKNLDFTKMQSLYDLYEGRREIHGHDGITNNQHHLSKHLVSGLSYAFQGAKGELPDISGWNVSTIKYMDLMFQHAKQGNPDVSRWDVSNVRTMNGMFAGTDKANPDTSQWNTANLKSTIMMFRDTKEANPNVSGWKTSKIQNMTQMFYNAEKANPDVSRWDTSNVKSLFGMFAYTKAANPNVAGWKTGNVIFMDELFRGAQVANPDVSQWDLSKVINVDYMFADTPIANPSVANWNTSNIHFFNYMFWFAKSANPDVSRWNMASATQVSGMFAHTRKANPNVADWNVANVRDMSSMFDGAWVAEPDVSRWNVANVRDMGNMFADTPKANPNVADWNVANVRDMSSMFDGAQVAEPDVSQWNVQNVEEMSWMFAKTPKANPNVADWNVANVRNMSYMFYGAQVANPDVSRWNVEHVRSMREMFYDAPAAKPDMSLWNMSETCDVDDMFNGLSAFPEVMPSQSAWSRLQGPHSGYRITNDSYKGSPHMVLNQDVSNYAFKAGEQDGKQLEFVQYDQLKSFTTKLSNFLGAPGVQDDGVRGLVKLPVGKWALFTKDGMVPGTEKDISSSTAGLEAFRDNLLSLRDDAGLDGDSWVTIAPVDFNLYADKLTVFAGEAFTVDMVKDAIYRFKLGSDLDSKELIDQLSPAALEKLVSLSSLKPVFDKKGFIESLTSASLLDLVPENSLRNMVDPLSQPEPVDSQDHKPELEQYISNYDLSKYFTDDMLLDVISTMSFQELEEFLPKEGTAHARDLTQFKAIVDTLDKSTVPHLVSNLDQILKGEEVRRIILDAASTAELFKLIDANRERSIQKKDEYETAVESMSKESLAELLPEGDYTYYMPEDVLDSYMSSIKGNELISLVDLNKHAYIQNKDLYATAIDGMGKRGLQTLTAGPPLKGSYTKEHAAQILDALSNDELAQFVREESQGYIAKREVFNKLLNKADFKTLSALMSDYLLDKIFSGDKQEQLLDQLSDASLVSQLDRNNSGYIYSKKRFEKALSELNSEALNVLVEDGPLERLFDSDKLQEVINTLKTEDLVRLAQANDSLVIHNKDAYKQAIDALDIASIRALTTSASLEKLYDPEAYLDSLNHDELVKLVSQNEGGQVWSRERLAAALPKQDIDLLKTGVKDYYLSQYFDNDKLMQLDQATLLKLIPNERKQSFLKSFLYGARIEDLNQYALTKLLMGRSQEELFTLIADAKPKELLRDWAEKHPIQDKNKIIDLLLRGRSFSNELYSLVENRGFDQTSWDAYKPIIKEAHGQAGSNAESAAKIAGFLQDDAQDNLLASMTKDELLNAMDKDVLVGLLPQHLGNKQALYELAPYDKKLDLLAQYPNRSWIGTYLAKYHDKDVLRNWLQTYLKSKSYAHNRYMSRETKLELAKKFPAGLNTIFHSIPDNVAHELVMNFPNSNGKAFERYLDRAALEALVAKHPKITKWSPWDYVPVSALRAYAMSNPTSEAQRYEPFFEKAGMLELLKSHPVSDKQKFARYLTDEAYKGYVQAHPTQDKNLLAYYIEDGAKRDEFIALARLHPTQDTKFLSESLSYEFLLDHADLSKLDGMNLKQLSYYVSRDSALGAMDSKLVASLVPAGINPGYFDRADLMLATSKEGLAALVKKSLNNLYGYDYEEWSITATELALAVDPVSLQGWIQNASLEKVISVLHAATLKNLVTKHPTKDREELIYQISPERLRSLIDPTIFDSMSKEELAAYADRDYLLGLADTTKIGALSPDDLIMGQNEIQHSLYDAWQKGELNMDVLYRLAGKVQVSGDEYNEFSETVSAVDPQDRPLFIDSSKFDSWKLDSFREDLSYDLEGSKLPSVSLAKIADLASVDRADVLAHVDIANLSASALRSLIDFDAMTDEELLDAIDFNQIHNARAGMLLTAEGLSKEALAPFVAPEKIALTELKGLVDYTKLSREQLLAIIEPNRTIRKDDLFPYVDLAKIDTRKLAKYTNPRLDSMSATALIYKYGDAAFDEQKIRNEIDLRSTLPGARELRAILNDALSPQELIKGVNFANVWSGTAKYVDWNATGKSSLEVLALTNQEDVARSFDGRLVDWDAVASDAKQLVAQCNPSKLNALSKDQLSQLIDWGSIDAQTRRQNLNLDGLSADELGKLINWDSVDPVAFVSQADLTGDSNSNLADYWIDWNKVDSRTLPNSIDIESIEAGWCQYLVKQDPGFIVQQLRLEQHPEYNLESFIDWTAVDAAENIADLIDFDAVPDSQLQFMIDWDQVPEEDLLAAMNQVLAGHGSDVDMRTIVDWASIDGDTLISQADFEQATAYQVRSALDASSLSKEDLIGALNAAGSTAKLNTIGAAYRLNIDAVIDAIDPSALSVEKRGEVLHLKHTLSFETCRSLLSSETISIDDLLANINYFYVDPLDLIDRSQFSKPELVSTLLEITKGKHIWWLDTENMGLEEMQDIINLDSLDKSELARHVNVQDPLCREAAFDVIAKEPNEKEVLVSIIKQGASYALPDQMLAAIKQKAEQPDETLDELLRALIDSNQDRTDQTVLTRDRRLNLILKDPQNEEKLRAAIRESSLSYEDGELMKAFLSSEPPGKIADLLRCFVSERNLKDLYLTRDKMLEFIHRDGQGDEVLRGVIAEEGFKWSDAERNVLVRQLLDSNNEAAREFLKSLVNPRALVSDVNRDELLEALLQQDNPEQRMRDVILEHGSSSIDEDGLERLIALMATEEDAAARKLLECLVTDYMIAGRYNTPEKLLAVFGSNPQGQEILRDLAKQNTYRLSPQEMERLKKAYSDGVDPALADLLRSLVATSDLTSLARSRNKFLEIMNGTPQERDVLLGLVKATNRSIDASTLVKLKARYKETSDPGLRTVLESLVGVNELKAVYTSPSKLFNAYESTPEFDTILRTAAKDGGKFVPLSTIQKLKDAYTSGRDPQALELLRLFVYPSRLRWEKDNPVMRKKMLDYIKQQESPDIILKSLARVPSPDKPNRPDIPALTKEQRIEILENYPAIKDVLFAMIDKTAQDQFLTKEKRLELFKNQDPAATDKIRNMVLRERHSSEELLSYIDDLSVKGSIYIPEKVTDVKVRGLDVDAAGNIDNTKPGVYSALGLLAAYDDFPTPFPLRPAVEVPIEVLSAIATEVHIKDTSMFGHLEDVTVELRMNNASLGTNRLAGNLYDEANPSVPLRSFTGVESLTLQPGQFAKIFAVSKDADSNREGVIAPASSQDYSLTCTVVSDQKDAITQSMEVTHTVHAGAQTDGAGLYSVDKTLPALSDTDLVVHFGLPVDTKTMRFDINLRNQLAPLTGLASMAEAPYAGALAAAGILACVASLAYVIRRRRRRAA